LQEEPSLSAGLTFDDNEGPTSAWDAAISIGDIDNSEDDDFEIRITSGPDLTAIGFYLLGSPSAAGGSLEVFDENDTSLATLAGIPTSSDRQFVGVVSMEAIARVEFDEDSDDNDIALRDFRFALRDSPFGIDPSGTWTETGTLTGSRGFHTATLLPSGKVLIAGGENGNSPLNIADLYDPATGTFEPTGALNHARSEHTATLLPSGKVLVVGGQGTSGSNVSLASVEIYDPETGEWAEGPSLDQGRRAHTATLLASGKVLVAGGDAKTVGNPLRCDTTETLNTAKVYDPTPPGTWEGALTMTESRRSHTATLLPDGKVLIAGGNNVTGSFWCNQLTSAEIYNPATSAVTAVVDHMDTGRHLHTATLLPSGKVLLAGGTETSSSDGITKTELFDVGTETFTDGSDLFHRHNLHSATLL
ncbi:MAG: hypothetical protein GY708_07320, partial [Actinomycetia bacterium]|nr:hypothetical protein [Actinomycetes bacterium]